MTVRPYADWFAVIASIGAVSSATCVLSAAFSLYITASPKSCVAVAEVCTFGGVAGDAVGTLFGDGSVGVVGATSPLRFTVGGVPLVSQLAG